MLIKAYAKINLHLKVVGQYQDGFHELQMINAKIDLADDIEIVYNTQSPLKVEYYNETSLNKNEWLSNIVGNFCKFYNIPSDFIIKITKNIPLGSGLGGGSSDVATIIRTLNQHFDLHLSKSELANFLLPYGTDIIYCLEDDLKTVRGKGEIIEDINLDLPYALILIKPNYQVSTKDIYQNVKVKGKNLTIPQEIVIMENDLEMVTHNLHPDLVKIKSWMQAQEFLKVQQTGSGPTLYGLVEPVNLVALYDKCIKRFPDMWIRCTHFLNNNKGE